MKYISVVGTRPQFLKLMPVHKFLIEKNHTHLIINTGQHFDKNLSDDILKDIKMPELDYNLKRDMRSSIKNIGKIISELEDIFVRENPDKVIVYGDCDTTLAGALTANKLKIYLIHLESGMRSYNKRMPEEINRIVVDNLSDLLCCATINSVNILKKEGFKNVKLVGNLQLESLKLLAPDKNILDKLKIRELNYILMTIHREYNTNKKKIGMIFEEVGQLEFKVIFPMHPRTKNIIKKFNIKIPKNVKVIDPVVYTELIALAKYSYIIITDSGGFQPEAWFLGKKCIVIRPETEWIEAIEAKNNILYNFEEKLYIFLKKFVNIKSIRYKDNKLDLSSLC